MKLRLVLILGLYMSALGAVTWDVGTLNQGQTASMDLQAQVNSGTAGQSITNTATHSQDQQDSNLTQDDPNETIQVQGAKGADIQIQKTVDYDGPNEGDIIHYTIKITNHGPEKITNLKVQDIIPSGLTLIAGAYSTGNWTDPIWDIGSLNVGQSQSLIITASVNSGTSGMDILNTASHSQDQNDLNISPDKPNAWIHIGQKKLVISKNLSSNQVYAGQILSYKIRVTNPNKTPMVNFDIKDILPTGITLIPSSGQITGASNNPNSNPQISGQILTWSNLSLAAGQTMSIGYKALVKADISNGVYTNIAYAEIPPVIQSGIAVLASNKAQASVQVLSDPTLNCSDLLGKVFIDDNRNGIQDKGEKPYPKAHIYTVNGVMIETDKQGLYHLPCAVKADQFEGSNFILKLDTRKIHPSLEVAGSNPKVIRLTKAMPGKLNFPLQKLQSIEVDLHALMLNSINETDQMLNDIVRLAKKKKSHIKINFLTDDQATANKTTQALETQIKNIWKKSGASYPIHIEWKIMQA